MWECLGKRHQHFFFFLLIVVVLDVKMKKKEKLLWKKNVWTKILLTFFCFNLNYNEKKKEAKTKTKTMTKIFITIHHTSYIIHHTIIQYDECEEENRTQN